MTALLLSLFSLGCGCGFVGGVVYANWRDRRADRRAKDRIYRALRKQWLAAGPIIKSKIETKLKLNN